jgi:O-Antigen ligase
MEQHVRDGESATSAVRQNSSPPLSRYLSAGIVVLLAALLVEVLFEGWVVIVLGKPSGQHLANGDMIIDPAGWPKTVKSALYIGLLAFSVAKLAVDRRWSILRTKADLAIAVAGVVLLAAGLVGGTRPVVIGEALFVYFRGAIVLYALRALNPSWRVVRRLLWLAGGLVAANAAIAFVQIFAGIRSYQALGWVDLTWARTNRVHALLSHPNDLGHVIGLTVLGLLAWFVTRPKVTARWWLLFGLLVISMGAAQSRESTIGVLLGGVLIAVLRGAQRKRMAIALGLVILTAAAPLVYSSSNRAEWARRLEGVSNAVEKPGTATATPTPAPSAASTCAPGEVACATPAPSPSSANPGREIRVLYAQEGLQLWRARPLLGYGIGQFGGIVAYKNDPNWNTSTKFGPNGFDKFGFRAKTVDSFWLHLLVEGGALGILAYLGWLILLGTPMVGVAVRQHRRRDGPAHPAFYWAPAALVFGGLIGLLSPSLEDPLFPPLMFGIVGIAWALLQRGEFRAPVAVEGVAPVGDAASGGGAAPAAAGRDAELTQESAGHR